MSTLDGVPVVIHDNSLQRLTGRHIHINETRFADIDKIDIGRQFNPFFADEKIPTLKDVLHLFDGTGMTINIEVKKQRRQCRSFLKNLLEMVGRYGGRERVVFSSFSRDILYRIGRSAPEYKRCLLTAPRAFFFLDILFFANILAVSGINPHISLLSGPLVRYARARKWEVVPWTVNEPDDIEKAVRLGVNAVITDDPKLVMEIFRTKNLE
jgi:glycerophosphoryl diester phosphodiesterase